MQQRIPIILSGLALVALIAVLALNIWPVTQTTSAQTITTDSRKRITVQGVGKVNVAPDIARINIGVQTEADDATSAVQANNTRMQAVIDQLLSAGVEEKNIQTSNFSIYPRYNYDSNPQRITGYIVNNTVSVKIALDSTSATLDQVIGVGANDVSGISFEVSDPEAALAQARAQAIANAQAKADQYAQAGNSQVGEVLVISELVGDSMPLPMVEGGMMARDEAANSVPIQGGEQLQQVTVTVTFALK